MPQRAATIESLPMAFALVKDTLNRLLSVERSRTDKIIELSRAARR